MAREKEKQWVINYIIKQNGFQNHSKLRARFKRTQEICRIELIFMETYFFGSLKGNKVSANLLCFCCHLLRFGVLIVFDGKPKIQILVAEFTK